LAPESGSVHFVRGQVLQKLGRTAEARLEMQKTAALRAAEHAKEERDLEAGPVPNPELTHEP
jgi:predicted RNA polymerase sigma factor